MHIKHIHCMIEKISECAKCEIESKGIENVDTEEMGKVIDILKDLCEAEYYAKISKAMDESEYGEDYNERGPMHRKFYRGQPRDSMGRYMRRGYEEPMYHMTPEMMREHDPEYWRDMDLMEGKMYYTETSGSMGSERMMRDMKEGRAGMARKGYMETKDMHKANTPEDKQKKMKELEKYMSELSGDITEMIVDASPEEKSMLKSKLQTLAQKVS